MGEQAWIFWRKRDMEQKDLFFVRFSCFWHQTDSVVFCDAFQWHTVFFAGIELCYTFTWHAVFFAPKIFILCRSRHLTHSVNLCDTFLWHAVFFVQNHLRTKTLVSLLRPFCVTLFRDMLYFLFGKFSFGMIFIRRVGITTTVVRRPHGFLFLMRKNDFLSLYRGIWLNVSNIIFSDLTPVKCRLSYFVLARWVAFDHTLCLSALTTRLKVEDF